MRKLSKYFALFLAIMILFSVCSVSAGIAEPRDMMRALDIMGAPDNQSIVSRGELALYLSKIISPNEQSFSAEGFTDLKPGDLYYNEISLMQMHGIMHGDENGNVYAERPVTFDEAVKMIMCLLGYAEYAEEIGGYPTGYLVAAKECKLLKGLTMRGKGWLEEDEAAQLIYNALSVPLFSISTLDADGSVIYTQNEDNTLLSHWQGLTRGEGVVTSVSGIDGVVGAQTNKRIIYIDGEKYRTSYPVEDFLGYYVEFYYDENNDIVVVLPSIDNKITTIPLNAVNDIDSNGFSYYNEKNKKEKIGFEAESEVYYNNALLNSLHNINLDSSEGNIVAIDHDGNGNAEYILINVYYDILVGSVDSRSKKIYDTYSYNGNLRVIDVDDEKNIVKFTDDFGTEMLIDDVAVNQLFTVSESIDKKTVYLHYNEEEIVGTIESVMTVNGSSKLLINGMEYETSKYFNDNFDVSVSYRGRFLLNKFGQIAAVFPENDLKFGYVVAGKATNTMSPEYQLKIMTEDNTFEIYTIADKVDWDDSGEKAKAEDFYGILCEGANSVVPQLIRYKLNPDGKINYVEIAGSRNGEHLNVLYELTSSAYVSASKIFGGKVTADATTKLFVVPKAGSNMEDIDYRVLSATDYLQRSTNYDATAYRTNTSSHHAEVLVVPVDIEQMAYTNHSPIAVFDSIAHTMDDDGNIQANITVYAGTTQKVIPLHDESILNNITDENGNTHTLKKGDVIRYMTTLRGNIATITLLYNRETQKPVGSLSSGSWNGSFHYRVGYVYDVANGNMWLSDATPTGYMNVADLYSYVAEDIIVYDTEREMLSVGGTNDINDYTHTGSPSKVFVFTKDSETSLIFTVR